MRPTTSTTPCQQQHQLQHSGLLPRPLPPPPHRHCRLHCVARSDQQPSTSKATNPVFSSKQASSPFSSSSSSNTVLQQQQQQQQHHHHHHHHHQQQQQEPGRQAGSWKAAGMSEHTFQWRGNSIHYVTAGCGKPVLLVHGFGASCGHYRRTIPFLAQNGYKVYALDLVGFGASDKPVQQYTIELWADLINDFLAEFAAGTPAVVVGNSIGSLSVLTAAAAAPQGQLAGLVLLNSAGAMNNKGVVSDWRIIAAWPLLMLIDLLLKTPPVARALLDNLAKPETITKVLSGVYVDQGAVDEELVDIILAPAFTPNALDVFVSVITGPAGPKPWELVPRISCPILVAWGDSDPFTPLDGPVGQYFLKQAVDRPGTEFVLLEGVGHCPQDDRPEVLHKELLPWLKARWQQEAAPAGSS